MATTEPSAPIITNAGTLPLKARKLFVNIPVWDLQRAIVFFEALRFVFNTQFTDSTATCMLIGSDAYFMLLTTDRFAGFASRPTADAQSTTGALYAISADSRTEVDALLAAALKAGGTPAGAPQDHGFMYSQDFYDLDGHHWEVFWMDPTTING